MEMQRSLLLAFFTEQLLINRWISLNTNLNQTLQKY